MARKVSRKAQAQAAAKRRAVDARRNEAIRASKAIAAALAALRAMEPMCREVERFERGEISEAVFRERTGMSYVDACKAQYQIMNGASRAKIKGFRALGLLTAEEARWILG